MEAPDITAMRKALDDFSQRLQTRIAEFQRTGTFSDVHNEWLTQLRRRHELLEKQVTEAERSGDVGKIIEAGVRRDVSKLFESLQEFEDRAHFEAIEQSNNKSRADCCAGMRVGKFRRKAGAHGGLWRALRAAVGSDEGHAQSVNPVSLRIPAMARALSSSKLEGSYRVAEPRRQTLKLAS
jgi:hypothetical protein